MFKSTISALLFAPFCLITVACQTIDTSDDRSADEQLGASSESLAGASACKKEVYYFVVDGDDKAAALSACGDVCEGVICPDFDTEAVASIPGNAGDDDTWRCDCTCPCNNDRDDNLGKITPQLRGT